MSSFPPPSFGPPVGGPSDRGPDRPRTPASQPLPYVTSTPPPSRGKNRSALFVVIALIVVAIGGVAIYLVTRDEDNEADTTGASAVTVEEALDATTDQPPATQATEPAPTAVTPTTDAPETSAAPETSVVIETTSTVAEPTTTIPTIAVAIPDGAIDLGRGVYIPVPTGWTQTNDPGAVVTLSDGTIDVAVQALARVPAEEPSVLVQEYINTFDADFETVSYGPTANIRRLDGEPAVDVYNTFYLTYDSAAGASLAGAVNVYIRGDGLSLIYDVYGPADATGGFPTDAADVLRLSLQNAPAINTIGSLTPIAPFRVMSAHTFVQVDALVGFTAAAGFNVIASGSGRGFVTNGIEDVQVDKVGAQADTNIVTASAQAVIGENYTDIAYSELVLGDPDPFGVVHGSFTWTGTYIGGNPSAGNVDFYYDPATTNAYIAFRTWFTGADNAEPYAAHTQFMLRSLFNSFTTIP